MGTEALSAECYWEKDIELMKTKVWKWFALLGGNSNPFDAFLLINGMKTLEIRMQRHCDNAMQVANYLEKHPVIAKVNYTGLAFTSRSCGGNETDETSRCPDKL